MWYDSVFCRDSSLEASADSESKRDKVRHGSTSDSMDEASCSSGASGIKGAGGDGCICSCPSTCSCGQPNKQSGPSSTWSKDSVAASGKKGKSKLWRRASSSSSKEERRVNEKQSDIDAQLMEQRSANSSELDSPSLSGSLPSVADSHHSHFSSELSCSDPETPKPPHPPSSAQMDPRAHQPAITPLPEVEHDRLEHPPPQAFSHRLLSSSPPGSPKQRSSGTFLYISEESAGENAEPERFVKEAARNATAQTVGPTRKRCIQTDI